MGVRIFAFGMVVFFLGCRSGTQEVKDFCSHGMKERREIYRSIPIEKRFSLFTKVDNDASCDDDSIAYSGYLVDELVLEEKDIDFLASKLEETNDEQIQQDIIWALERNSSRLKGRHDIADLAKNKADSMTGTLLDRIIGITIAVDGTRKQARRIDEMANSK